MKKIILDFKDCQTSQQLHKLLKVQLGLPDYYGENLDALWDCMTGWVEYPVTVELRGLKNHSDELSEEIAGMLDILFKAEVKIPDIHIKIGTGY